MVTSGNVLKSGGQNLNKSDVKTINKGCLGQENQGNLLMTILKGQSG